MSSTHRVHRSSLALDRRPRRSWLEEAIGKCDRTLRKHARADDDEMRGCAVGYADLVRQSCHEQGVVALSVDEQRRSRLSGGANVKVQTLQARVRQRMRHKLIRHRADSDLEAGRVHLSTCSQ